VAIRRFHRGCIVWCMQEQKQNVRFYQLLDIQLASKLKKFSNEPMTPVTLHLIRETINDTLNAVFSASRHKLSQPAVKWLADQYFKLVTFTTTDRGEQRVVDLVVIHEYKLSMLDFNDVQLLHNLFVETPFGEDLHKEYAARTAS